MKRRDRARSGPRRPASYLVAALGAVLFVGPFAFPSSAQVDRCDVRGQVVEAGGWTSVHAPEFPRGSHEITLASIDPTNPNLMFASNGVVLMVSTDRGCRWRESFSVYDHYSSVRINDVRPLDPEIRHVEPMGGRVYLVIETTDPASRPDLWVSNDAGDRWEQSPGLAVAVGAPVDLAVGGNGFVLYLLTSTPEDGPGSDVLGQGAQKLYLSTTGGERWEDVHTFEPGADTPLGPVGSASIAGVAVDPLSSSTVWAYGDAGLLRSSNSGRSFDAVDVGASISAVDVYHEPREPARILAFDAQQPTMYRSDDSGTGWSTHPIPDVVGSVAPSVPWVFQRSMNDPSASQFLEILTNSPLFGEDAYAISTSSGAVYYHYAGLGFVDVSPTDGRPVFDIGSALDVHAMLDAIRRSSREGTLDDLALGPMLWGYNVASIESKSMTEIPAAPPPLGFDIPPVEVTLEEPTLRPRRTTVRLDRGEKTAVDYRLTIPRTPTPLDVYFLIDVSGSMDTAIDGIRFAMAEIVTELAHSGIDVWFGVGEYRAYNDYPAYRRVLDITGNLQAVEEGLRRLDAGGGGAETQLAALYQTATGEGQEDPGAHAYIEPDQQANFRPGSLRVVINVTDETFSEGEPHPSYTRVNRALNSKDIGQVGLAIQDLLETTTGAGDQPRRGLERVAAGTYTFAPADGVDCDGDEAPELEPGAPLVCIIDPARSEEAAVMAPAIVNLLKAVRDVGSVELDARPSRAETSAADAVTEVDPGVIGSVDFKQFQQLDFEVTFKCPRFKTPRRVPVDIVARARGRPLAAADAMVVCRSKPEPVPERVLPLAGVLLLPPLAPPPVRPPDPLPQPNPHPQPNPAAQSQPQAGFATEEQEQPQLAYVPVDTAPQPGRAVAGDHEYYLSGSNRDDRIPPPELLYGGALAMAFVFGFATVLQRRTRHQQVYGPQRRKMDTTWRR